MKYIEAPKEFNAGFTINKEELMSEKIDFMARFKDKMARDIGHAVLAKVPIRQEEDFDRLQTNYSVNFYVLQPEEFRILWRAWRLYVDGITREENDNESV